MAQQARAEATRQKIIEVSIELFDRSGFSGTCLNQIVRRAGITPGAFYYHFASKDEVAFAIIDLVERRMAELRTHFIGNPEAGLDNVITMTFQLSMMLTQDRAYSVAAYLEHTMQRHTLQGLGDVASRVQLFLASISRAIRALELRDGVTPEAAARTLMTVIYGCLAMTDLIPGNLPARLAECWRAVLPGLVAPDLLSHFEETLATANSGPGVA